MNSCFTDMSREIPDAASQITGTADRPVTIIYPSGRNLAEGVSAEDGSTGIRITSDPFCSELDRAVKKTNSLNFGKYKRRTFSVHISVRYPGISSIQSIMWYGTEEMTGRSTSPRRSLKSN